jgi:hypothetical protein
MPHPNFVPVIPLAKEALVRRKPGMGQAGGDDNRPADDAKGLCSKLVAPATTAVGDDL